MIGYPAGKSVFLSGFVQGQGQKSEQRLVEFRNQPISINYGLVKPVIGQITEESDCKITYWDNDGLKLRAI